MIKKLSPTQAYLWRLLHEVTSDLDQFVINEIARSPFETRKLRQLIPVGSNVIEVLMSFLYLGMPSFRQLRYYFFLSQTEFDKHHTCMYIEQLPNRLSHLEKKKKKEKQSITFNTSFS